MSVTMTDAMKTAKEIEKQLVVAENRLEFVKAEEARLKQSRDVLQAEIDRKTADYNIYMAQRDTESKRQREETQAQTVQLEKDKAEFVGIMRDFQNKKSSFEDQLRNFDVDKAKVEERMNGIRTFIAAVQRALSVLGL